MDLSENRNAKFFDYQQAHPWETVRRYFIRQKFLAKFPHGTKVIDVGCGNCFVAAALVKLSGTAVTAVDHAFTPEMLAKLRVAGIPEKLELCRDTRDIPDGNYQAVMLLDVLEHVADDVACLRELRENRQVEPGAIFFITVPAFMTLFTGHDRELGHFRRYTCCRLKQVAANAGLEIVEHGYFFISLLFPVILRRLAEACGLPWFQHGGTGDWQHSRPLTAVVEFCLYADILTGKLLKFLNFPTPGLSCYLICRKPR